MKTFKIEYEIPPLRAIFNAEIEATDQTEAEAHISTAQPSWKVRKLAEMPSEADALKHIIRDLLDCLEFYIEREASKPFTDQQFTKLTATWDKAVAVIKTPPATPVKP